MQFAYGTVFNMQQRMGNEPGNGTGMALAGRPVDYGTIKGAETSLMVVHYTSEEGTQEQCSLRHWMLRFSDYAQPRMATIGTNFRLTFPWDMEGVKFKMGAAWESKFRNLRGHSFNLNCANYVTYNLWMCLPTNHEDEDPNYLWNLRKWCAEFIYNYYLLMTWRKHDVALREIKMEIDELKEIIVQRARGGGGGAAPTPPVVRKAPLHF